METAAAAFENLRFIGQLLKAMGKVVVLALVPPQGGTAALWYYSNGQ